MSTGWMSIVIGGLVLLHSGCDPIKSHSTYSANHADIMTQGRMIENDSSKVIMWSGSSIKVNFEGSSISAELRDENFKNYFNVILDDSLIQIIRPDTIKKTYLLADDLVSGKHTLELFKRTEWPHGKTWFTGFQIENGELLEADPGSVRTIEFYGNSITAGYAIENYTGGDSPDSTYTNNFLSYAKLTADYFDANYKCICRSGIGVMISWYPVIMPEVYDRLDPDDSLSIWGYPAKESPQVIVVNLMQNDSWLVNMPEYETFTQRFGDQKPTEEDIISSYANFISSIREKYPEASIICAMGSMDATKEGSPWPGYVKEAVVSLNDPNLYTHFFDFTAKKGHPRVEHNQVMAKSLIRFIEENIEW